MPLEQFTVRICDRDYRLSCETSEKPALMAAVTHVDAEMQAIRTQGRVASSERIAVFAALNIASALLDGRAPAPLANGVADPVAENEILRRMQTRLQSLDALLDTADSSQEPLF